MKPLRRPGKSPQELGITDSDPSCPDIWEADNGDFIVIGYDITETVDLSNTDAVISIGEKVVQVPRVTMLSAVNALAKENK